MTKEKSCLVTQALIGGVEWYLTAPTTVIKPERGGDGKLTWKEKAYNDLNNMLNRVKTPFPIEAKQGVDFEKKVYEHANSDKLVGSENFQKILKEVKGFEFYQKGGINVKIGKHNCYLYGKYDAIKTGTFNFTTKQKSISHIIDIKTTKNYTMGKYVKTFQHKLYCYITGCDLFEYVIAVWDTYPKIRVVHKEVYTVKNRDLLISEVHKTIEECFEVIQDLDLWDTYKEKYCLY
jgi:hypothetical protein